IHNGLVLIWGASAYLIALAATDGRDILDYPVVNRVLEYIGSRSYAIYLVHTAVLLLFETLALRASGSAAALVHSKAIETLRVLAVTGITLGIAEWLHQKVELPGIRAGKRYVMRAQQTEVATAA